MGNTASNTGHKPLVNQKEPLTFHSVHSEHIRLYNEGRIARRVESFCKGICFSARPIGIGELVSIRCSDISTNWSGFLRVGFTAHNPANMNSHNLPRYACPDMTNLPGNWAKALPERFGIVNYVITYSVNRQGDVYMSLNGENLPGPFFGGVNISGPLWALVDIYGNATGVEFLDKTSSLISTMSPSSPPLSSSISEQAQTRRTRKSTSTVVPSTSIPVTSPSKHHARVTFSPLVFHDTTGKFVALNAEKNVATRHMAEYANAYVFCERPINLLEKIVVQVVGMDMSYTGGLTVGMTACDPHLLSREDFPDDSDQLLDRPEYWVVHKDVVTSAEVGDELSFTMSNDGEIQFSRNAQPPVVIMHVDKTIPLWLFWDLYGQFNQIKLFGIVAANKPKTRSTPPPLPPLSAMHPLSQQLRTLSLDSSLPAPQQASPLLTVELPPPLPGAPPIPPRLQRSSSLGGAASSMSPNSESKAAAASTDAIQEVDESADNMANECTVCFDKPCDCVIYTCGHMCMCYECAINVKSGPDPLCPICRQDIKDVIRIYKS